MTPITTINIELTDRCNKQVQEHEEKEKWIEEFRKEAKIKKEKAYLSFERAVKASQ